MGIVDLAERDVYLISPSSSHNVKIRRYKGGSVLKFKLIWKADGRGIIKTLEDPGLIHPFPVSIDLLQEAAQLLNVVLPETPADETVEEEGFLGALGESVPPVRIVEVTKKRSQFEIDGGWLELAAVDFPTRRVDSLSIQSPGLDTVYSFLDSIHVGAGLVVMDYVEACVAYSSPGKMKS
jgi:hypothetical protein